MYEAEDFFHRRAFIRLLMQVDLDSLYGEVISLVLQIGFMLRCAEYAALIFTRMGIEYEFDNVVDSLKISEKIHIIDIDDSIRVTRDDCTTVFGRDVEGFYALFMYDRMLDLNMTRCVTEFLVEEKIKRVLIEGLEVFEDDVSFKLVIHDYDEITLEKTIIVEIGLGNEVKNIIITTNEWFADVLLKVDNCFNALVKEFIGIGEDGERKLVRLEEVLIEEGFKYSKSVISILRNIPLLTFKNIEDSSVMERCLRETGEVLVHPPVDPDRLVIEDNYGNRLDREAVVEYMMALNGQT
jgi:hypothetical protein